MIFLSKNLKFLRLKNGFSQNYISDMLGYKTFTTIQKWESGISEPNISVITKLADLYNVSISDLIYKNLELEYSNGIDDKRERLINNYDKLRKNNNKIALVDYSKELIEKEKEENNVVDLYPVETIEKAAAGVGFSYISNEKAIYYTDRNNLAPYDLATVVIGDSMEPKYNNGDVILLKQGYDNINGGIYVIDYNGKTYVKKLYNDGDRYRLISINKNYENIIIDIPIDRDIYFNIVGKVVDSFTPVEL